MMTLCKTTLAALVLTALTSNVAVADHNSVIKELSEHAYNLERQADRADRDIRYYFRNAPQAKCLRDQFCLIEEKADDLQKALRHRVDIHDVEECLEELDAAFVVAQKHMAELRKWSQACRPTTIRFSSGNLTVCSTSGSSDINLRRLCGRVEDIGKTLGCMITEVDELLGHNRGHNHGRQLHNQPAPRPQPIQVNRRVPVSRHQPALGRYPGRRITIPIKKSGLAISFSF